MSSWGRFQDAVWYAFEEHLPNVDIKDASAFRNEMEKILDSYLYETLDMHHHIWDKLKKERAEAWDSRNHWEKVAWHMAQLEARKLSDAMTRIDWRDLLKEYEKAVRGE